MVTGLRTRCASLRRPLARGASLIEVLVALIVIAVGLLGLAGLQLKLQTSEFEAFQRSQALLLVQDYASRILLNRLSAGDYVTDASTPLGADMTCPTATGTTAQRDAREWCLALQGATEKVGSSLVGVLVGGRGCVEEVGSGAGTYRVTVAWQGMRPLTSPGGSACAKDLFDGDLGCQNDRCRRVISTVVQIGDLSPAN